MNPLLLLFLVGATATAITNVAEDKGDTLANGKACRYVLFYKHGHEYVIYETDYPTEISDSKAIAIAESKWIPSYDDFQPTESVEQYVLMRYCDTLPKKMVKEWSQSSPFQPSQYRFSGQSGDCRYDATWIGPDGRAKTRRLGALPRLVRDTYIERLWIRWWCYTLKDRAKVSVRRFCVGDDYGTDFRCDII